MLCSLWALKKTSVLAVCTVAKFPQGWIYSDVFPLSLTVVVVSHS